MRVAAPRGPRTLSSRNAKAAATARQRAAFSPLYKQIKGLLLESLGAGEWKPGESIPSEVELANLYQVSQGTVRKAIDELAAESVLIRRQGKGTFVATHHEDEVRYRFLRLASRHGQEKREKPASKFLSCEVRPAEQLELDLLELPVASDIVEIKRVMHFGDTPVVFEQIILPASSFKELTLETLQKQLPLYGLFESDFGVSMIRAEEQLYAVAASDEVSTLLDVPEGYPLLAINRIAYTYGDKPIEIRKGMYLTKDYFYRNSLN
ncbi:MAG: GntR family transcriptional regulator [Alcaligenaceae bacterium]|nr:GntR family transcriptional regulator [Alcaligenaceae bacterium]